MRSFVDLLDGDINEALMFSQISYWNGGVDGKSKLRVIRNGTHWLAKSAPDWHEELGLTDRQAYRSTQVLKRKGLIETKVMKFNGSPTVHIRLTHSGEEVLKNQLGHSHFPSKEIGSALEGKSLTENTANNTTETTTDSAGKPAEAVGEDIQIGKENSGKVVKKYNAEVSLGSLWNALMSAKYQGYEKALTKKEYGQLKQLKQKLGDKNEAAVNLAIKDWIQFALQAKKEKGCVCVPEKPVIGFLLQNVDVIHSMLFSQIHDIKKAQEWESEKAKEEAEKEKAIAAAKADKEDIYYPTPEEVCATIMAFKKKS